MQFEHNLLVPINTFENPWGGNGSECPLDMPNHFQMMRVVTFWHGCAIRPKEPLRCSYVHLGRKEPPGTHVDPNVGLICTPWNPMGFRWAAHGPPSACHSFGERMMQKHLFPKQLVQLRVLYIFSKRVSAAPDPNLVVRDCRPPDCRPPDCWPPDCRRALVCKNENIYSGFELWYAKTTIFTMVLISGMQKQQYLQWF